MNNTLKSLVSIAQSFILGALALAVFSSFQKVLIGAPLSLKGYLIPVLFGGTCGLAIGQLYKTLKQRNEKLARQAEDLEKTNQALHSLNDLNQKIFSILAHDTKNSIGGAYTLLKVITTGDDNLDEIKTDLEIVKHSLHAQLQHMQVVLEWASLHAKTRDFVYKEIILADLAKDIEEYCKGRIEAKSGKLSIHPTGRATFVADYNLVFTILNNLICNATKFSEEHGVIDVSIIANNALTIAVTDNGKGIDRDHLDTLFEFNPNRIRHLGKEDHGTGLGLILIKELLDMYGGTVTAQSEPGVSTTFTVVIPEYAPGK